VNTYEAWWCAASHIYIYIQGIEAGGGRGLRLIGLIGETCVEGGGLVARDSVGLRSERGSERGSKGASEGGREGGWQGGNEGGREGGRQGERERLSERESLTGQRERNRDSRSPPYRSWLQHFRA